MSKKQKAIVPGDPSRYKMPLNAQKEAINRFSDEIVVKASEAFRRTLKKELKKLEHSVS